MSFLKKWNQSRDEFNHAWLKNRLIMTLGRTVKVLEGAVENDAIWNDLFDLLCEWPARQTEALQILENYPKALLSKPSLSNRTKSQIDPELANWLTDLAHHREMDAEKPEETVLTSKLNIAIVDAKIQALMKTLADSPQKISSITILKTILELQVATTELGKSFSYLVRKAAA